MECQALGACPDENLTDLLDILGRVSGDDGRPLHLLETVIEGASYAKNVKGPQLRLVHDLQHLDSASLPGTHANLQRGTLHSTPRVHALTINQTVLTLGRIAWAGPLAYSMQEQGSQEASK